MSLPALPSSLMDSVDMDVDVNPDRFISEVEANFPPGAEDRWDKDITTEDNFPSTLDSASTPRREWISMITWVVSQCDTLDQKYSARSEAAKLLDSHDFLIPILRECCKIRSCRKLRRLRILQQLQKPAPQPILSSTGVELSQERVQRLSRAWESPYNGNYHKTLHTIIQEMKQNSTENYSNTASIIQSSGTGKSRMIKEVASLVFTVPLNIRRDEDSRAYAYPLPDKDVRDFFLKICDEECVRIRYHSFFSSLFQQVSEYFMQQPRTYKEKEEAETTEAWNLYLQWNKGMLFEDVCKEANSASENVIVQSKTFKRTQQEKKEKIQETHPQKKKKTDDPLQTPLQLHRAKSRNRLTTLFQHMPFYKKAVRLLVVFDEAHELTKRCAETSEKSLYDILLSVLCDYANFGLFVLFLSTTSQISALAQPPRVANSARFIASRGHQAPIIETPFDCADLLVEQGIKRTELADIGFMAKFGRPLYRSLLEYGVVDERELINFIRIKLISHANISESYLSAKFRCLGLLAAVDVRLCLQYEPYHEVNVTQNLVASHMRLMYTVPSHREYFRSGYSSEPILAEAAAQQVNCWRLLGLNPMLDCLKGQMKDGLLDRGQRGEVVARMLLTMAYDEAVRKRSQGEQYLFSSGCTVVEWVKELFPERDANTILQHPLNKDDSDTEFGEVFGNSWLRFTHFVKAGDDHIFHQDALFAAFVRGMAFICRDNQALVDLLLPVLLREEDGVRPKNMSAIFVQVKRRQKRSHLYVNVDQVKQTPINIFRWEGAEAAKHPYITLLMDLGVQEEHPSMVLGGKTGAFKKNPAPILKSSASSASHTRPKGIPISSGIRRSTRKGVAGHPKYELVLFGCTHKSCAVIKKEDDSSYQDGLLRLHELLYDHSRPATIHEVLRLKPFFVLGKDSYEWAESESLNAQREILEFMDYLDEDEGQ